LAKFDDLPFDNLPFDDLPFDKLLFDDLPFDEFTWYHLFTLSFVYSIPFAVDFYIQNTLAASSVCKFPVGFGEVFLNDKRE
jgi:hypothetical protein